MPVAEIAEITGLPENEVLALQSKTAK